MYRMRTWFFGLLAALLIVSPLSLFGQQRGPIVIWETKHDVSPPLRNMPIYHGGATKKEAEKWRRLPMPPQASTSQMSAEPGLNRDAAIQTSATTALAATSGLSFEGLGNGQYGFTVNSAPPDTNGAVGATQYVQMVNSSYAVFNKSGTLVAGPFASSSLWSGFGGGCQTNNDGDGIVMYDKLASRWILAQFSVSTTPYLQCIAVSTTSDATGTYNRYSFQYSNFPDYPKMGVWPDGYYISFNMFNGTTNAFLGAQACVYNRTAMLNGTTANQICFQQGSSVGGLLPSDLDGSTQPPAGSPNYYMTYGTNSLQLYKFHADFTNTANSTFTGPTNIPVASFTALCNGGTCVPQPGTTNQLDSLADRLMYRLAYRNFGSHESLVVSHSVTGGARWYEIQNPNGTPQVAQQGTFGPDSNTRWMSSIAMDQAGDIGLGYTVSSSTVDPGVRYTGRIPSDAAGTMETETTLVNGTGVQNGTLTRWGDYSAMQIDPTDDCTFWYTQEYMKTTGTFNWNTRIGTFKFSGCGGGGTPSATLSPTSLTFASQNVGTTSAAQAITLSNGGTAALSISSIATSGDYAQTNNCGTSLAAGANCTISVTFTPTASGTRTGTLTVTDNAANSPQTASLTGTGASSGTPSASLSPTSLTFASQVVGTTSAAQNITLSNGGTAALSISGIGISGDFAQSNNCGTSLAAGANCTINVTFKPTATGTRTGTLSVTDNATGSPQTASLTGTGAAAGGGCTTGTLSNGGFETGDLSCWTTTGTDAAVTGGHSGTYAARVGSTSPSTDSNIAQTFTAPTNGGTISFWYKVVCPDTVTYDWATATLKDNTAGTTATLLGKTCTNNNTWVHVSGNLTASHSYTLTLASHDDNYAGDPTYTLYDDVTVTASAPTTQIIVNPGFETGSLSSWTTGGVLAPSVSTTQKHSGTYSALLGGASGTEPNGDSSLYQTITIPSTATKATLTFYYWPSTTDTITYDWQEAQVQNSTGGTLASIMKVCSNAHAWTLVTYDLTSYKGQTIRLYFNAHGDGYGDLTYMYVDDINVNVQ